MSEIKLSLSIELQGSKMFSKEECLKTTHKVVEKKTKGGKMYKKSIKVLIEDENKMDKNTLRVSDEKGKNTEIVTFFTRKSRPALQSINLGENAYNYMISSETPTWVKPKDWERMSKKERLKNHLTRIAEGLGGKLVSYKVFDD